MTIKHTMISAAVVGGMTISTLAAAADTRVINSNIAAIFQPDTRASAVARGSARESVSLLDGIVGTWRDPSRQAPATTSAPDERMASTRGDDTTPTGTLAEKSLRGVFDAYSSN